MNTAIISQLIKKDWEQNQGPMMGYTLVGFLALWLLTMGGKISFYVGLVLLISMVIIIGIHMTYNTVINERKNQTLPFIMSLPISHAEYTLAKVTSNLSITIVLWAVLLLTLFGLVSYSPAAPNGLLPYLTLTMVYLLMLYVIVFSLAMITESEIVTTVSMTVTNISISIFMMLTASMSQIGPFIEGEAAVWNGTVMSILAVMLFVMLCFIASIFYFQKKKRSFL